MNILLAVDNSEHSRVALDVLLSRLWPISSSFKVICAVERREPVFAVMSASEAESFHNRALEAAEKFTAGVAARLQEAFPDCNASSESMFGDSKEIILEHIDRWPADLVVLGSHGRHGLPRIFLGSVSQTVLLYGRCSTLIARYQQAHKDLPEFDKNILLAVDDTRHSRDALEWVLELPWHKETKFSLLSVLAPIVEKYSDGIDALYRRKFSGSRLEARQAAQSFLEECAGRLKAKVGDDRVELYIQEGEPAEVISLMAKSLPAGLIVMGSRLHGQVTRFFMGSVSQEVVLQAPCPVEVVKKLARVSD